MHQYLPHGPPCVGLQKSGEDSQRGGLTGAIGAEKAIQATFRHSERKVIKRCDRAIGLAQMSQLQQRHQAEAGQEMWNLGSSLDQAAEKGIDGVMHLLIKQCSSWKAAHDQKQTDAEEVED